MTFLWAQWLWLVLVVPALVLFYVALLRRKKKAALRYANLALVKEALTGRFGFRRHIPPVLYLMALAFLIVGTARPETILTLPSQRANVILTIDVSGSMKAEDVQPSRIGAAQEAVRSFVHDQPSDVQIGVVTFGINAMSIQAPTVNREDILKSIEHLELQYGTNIGDGILMSLKTLFPDGTFEVNRRYERYNYGGVPLGSQDKQQSATSNNFVPVPPGSNTNAVVILLSDGQASTGPDPEEAARKAAERGVRIFTVGLGSKDGALITFGGRTMRVQLNEEELQSIADLTRGKYFRAESAADLKSIYKSLNTQLIMETKKTEITALFSAPAAVFALLAAGLSLLWFNRIL